jgi:hypothetical protein
MIFQVNIDFDNIYEITPVSENFKKSFFETELVDGPLTNIHVRISNESHELDANIYNLSFGPLDKRGVVDDKVALRHRNYSKVFSTILFRARTYLLYNPDHYLGIDGSNNARAYLYYRVIQRNYDYLNNYFDIYGLKYYVRITRLERSNMRIHLTLWTLYCVRKSSGKTQKIIRNLCTTILFLS